MQTRPSVRLRPCDCRGLEQQTLHRDEPPLHGVNRQQEDLQGDRTGQRRVSKLAKETGNRGLLPVDLGSHEAKVTPVNATIRHTQAHAPLASNA